MTIVTCRCGRVSAPAAVFSFRNNEMDAAKAYRFSRRWSRRAASFLAVIGLSALTAMPGVAEPDFATAFRRLDRDGDGGLSKYEFTLRGPEGERYATPVNRYETSDGFGVEVWESPFGARTVSTSLDSDVWLNSKRDVLRTQPDRAALLWRAMSDRDHNESLTLDELEAFLRSHMQRLFEDGDTDRDGALAEREIIALAYPAEHNPDFQGGSGGLATRAKVGELRNAAILAWDIDGDHKVTSDEVLEGWLARLVGAYALQQ